MINLEGKVKIKMLGKVLKSMAVKAAKSETARNLAIKAAQNPKVREVAIKTAKKVAENMMKKK